MGHPQLHTTVPLGELPGWEEMPSTTDLLGDLGQLASPVWASVSSSVNALPGRAQVQMRPSWQAVMIQSSRNSSTVRRS